MNILLSFAANDPLNTTEHNLERLPLWAQELIRQLTGRVQQLTAQVQQLTGRVNELEAQLAKKVLTAEPPPSSDGLKKSPKTQSLRGKSGSSFR